MTATTSLKRQLIAVALILALFPPPGGMFSNPQNPEIRTGMAEFDFETENALFINQDSDKLIIDWESFSIDHGELTRFIQPNSSSAALNRVFTGDPSAIHGQLEANGNIILINPNGILVGPGGRVDTAGFIASTLDVSDADFLDGGDLTFSGGSTAAVTNLGTINSIDGGDIFLIARRVENAGNLTAEGTVGLAAGSQVVVAAAGEERVMIAPGGEGSVDNSGVIEAATAELKAAGGNEYALAINNDGLVRAKGFENRGGKLYLSAGGGRIVNNGRMESTGMVKFNNPNGVVESVGSVAAKEEENGGSIVIDASQVRILGPSTFDVSGNEGGDVAIRAKVIAQVDGQINARGAVGNGGKIDISADEIGVGATGAIRADGEAEGGMITFGASPLAPREAV
ncbi:MAG: filamentous hemagglutinin N-terminal domain-containing protein, partial [Verrucomicrobiota bacterium]